MEEKTSMISKNIYHILTQIVFKCVFENCPIPIVSHAEIDRLR